MELKYNVTGSERKNLVGAISTTLNAPTKYLGMPTASYEVGSYTIDKVGTLTGPDSLDLEDALHQAGFDADGDTRHYDEPDTYESGLGGMGALPSVEELTSNTSNEGDGVYYDSTEDYYNAGFRNAETAEPKRKGILDTLVDELNENAEDGEHWERLHHELTIIDERGREHSLDGRFTSTVGDETADEPERLTVEMPLDGFTPEKLNNLTKMVQAKEPLLKQALGVDELPIRHIDEDGGKLAFPWFLPCDGDDYLAYAKFISRLCKTAKTKKRVTAKAQEDNSNPKFSFRVWLISLGMVGDDYKTARRLLLRNLEGNSSFKSADSAARWNEKHLAKKTEGNAQ